jgi:UDP-N-acetylglucosamine 2-epimerase (non-hydrolysing)
LDQICSALVELTRRRVDLSVILPVHPNPAVRGALIDRLRDRERILLIDPVGYADFAALMRGSRLIVTDSGGVQEEAPAIGKRVIVIRERTERREGFETGLVKLVGCDRDALVDAVDEMWDRPEETSGRIGPGRFANPYGDGWASERITRAVLNFLGIEPEPAPAGFHETWDERRGDPNGISNIGFAYVDSGGMNGYESAV